jgi:hypothetical protein
VAENDEAKFVLAGVEFVVDSREGAEFEAGNVGEDSGAAG